MGKLLSLAAAGIGLAAVGVAAVHSYLDVMYKETIPIGPMKRMQNAMDNGDFIPLGKMSAKSNEWLDTQDVEVIDHTNARGQVLKGYLLPAPEASKKFTVFAHGYRSSHTGDPVNFAQFYHEKGYNFFSCDHTAAGDSEGDFVGFDYFESKDMLEWLDYLIERFGDDIEIVVHGVSMGGATVCQMASKVPPQVKVIVSDCAYVGAKEEFISVANSVGINRTAPAVFAAFNALNKKLAGYDLEKTDVRESVKNSRVPMLFVHGGSDDFVPTWMGYELYELCGNEKDLLIVPEAKHADSVVFGTEDYYAKLDEFLGKYM
jgi:hypothetical protein